MMGFRDRQADGVAIERDLARLADGTLEPSRRERVERRVRSSSELQARLREQRRAVAAARSIAQPERAPLTLRTRRQAMVAHSRSRGRGLGLGLGLVSAVGTLALTVTLVGAGQTGLTLAQAATLATRPPTIAVAEPRDDGVTLPRLRAAELPFPYWGDRFDWRATGARTDRLGGRLETTVFYRRGPRLIAYTIVAGDYLADFPGARTMLRSGTWLTVYPRLGDRVVVTWLRRGHTCVLSGRDVPLSALTALATWSGRGRIPY